MRQPLRKKLVSAFLGVSASWRKPHVSSFLRVRASDFPCKTFGIIWKGVSRIRGGDVEDLADFEKVINDFAGESARTRTRYQRHGLPATGLYRLGEFQAGHRAALLGVDDVSDGGP